MIVGSRLQVQISVNHQIIIEHSIIIVEYRCLDSGHVNSLGIKIPNKLKMLDEIYVGHDRQTRKIPSRYFSCSAIRNKYEIGSVEKFLKASFMHIAVVSSDRRHLNPIREGLIESGAEMKTVGFYSPNEFLSKLSDWALDDPEGGIAEKNNPHRNPNLNLVSDPQTAEERAQNRKK